MVDLISRENEIERAKQMHFIGCTEEENAEYRAIIVSFLQKSKTAYDKEQVKKDIQERMSYCEGATKYGNKNAQQQEYSYSMVHFYEVAQDVEDILEIVERGGIDDT